VFSNRARRPPGTQCCPWSTVIAPCRIEFATVSRDVRREDFPLRRSRLRLADPTTNTAGVQPRDGDDGLVGLQWIFGHGRCCGPRALRARDKDGPASRLCNSRISHCRFPLPLQVRKHGCSRLYLTASYYETRTRVKSYDPDGRWVGRWEEGKPQFRGSMTDLDVFVKRCPFIAERCSCLFRLSSASKTRSTFVVYLRPSPRAPDRIVELRFNRLRLRYEVMCDHVFPGTRITHFREWPLSVLFVLLSLRFECCAISHRTFDEWEILLILFHNLSSLLLNTVLELVHCIFSFFLRLCKDVRLTSRVTGPKYSTAPPPRR